MLNFFHKFLDVIYIASLVALLILMIVVVAAAGL